MIVEQRSNMEYNEYIEQLVDEICEIPEEKRFYDVMKKYDIVIPDVPRPTGITHPRQIVTCGVVVIDFKNTIQKQYLFVTNCFHKQLIYNYYDLLKQEYIHKDYVKDIALMEEDCPYADFVYEHYVLNTKITEDDFVYIFGRDILVDVKKRFWPFNGGKPILASNNY